MESHEANFSLLPPVVWKGNVFTTVCESVHRGVSASGTGWAGGFCPGGVYIPHGQTLPQADTPPR